MTYQGGRPLALNSHRSIPLATSLISAGPAVEIGNDYALLDVNEHITRGREGFVAFVVTGQSGVPEINPGNIIFVDTWAQPVNGDIVAVMINDLVCVKRFEMSERGLYLVSNNQDYQPRQVTASDNFHALGVYAGHLVVPRR